MGNAGILDNHQRYAAKQAVVNNNTRGSTIGTSAIMESDFIIYDEEYCHLGQKAFGRHCMSVAGPILVSSVELVGFEHVTSVSDFMMWYPDIETIDLSALKNNITAIKGNGFLTMCKGLSPSIDLSALANVTTIENGFMMDCSGLITMDLTPLKNVTTIGNRFLTRCTNLTTVHMKFENLVAVGSYFMAGCSSLGVVDMSSLGKLAVRGTSFMEGCRRL